MALSSIGDLARSFMLRNQTTALKQELELRSQEATTGRTGDAGRLLRGDFTQLRALDATLSGLRAMRTSTAEADLTAAAMQSALDTVSTLATGLGSSLLSVASPGEATSLDSLGQDAMSRFRSVVATLNTRVGDRSVFGGVETRNAALAAPEALLDLVAAAVGPAATAAEVELAVTDWFADPSGYAAQGYLGGPPLDPQTVAAGEKVRLDATAADPAIRETLAALAMAALLDRGVLGTDTDQRGQLARRAGERLIETGTDRTILAARIGTAQQRIADAETRNAAEETALQIARNGLVAVDGYEAATRLTEAEAQLDTLYAITARLQRLSLADYL
jgi:flagellar hook-associated protein 3 FlgL